MSHEAFRFQPVTKDPDETLPVALRFYALCANLWRPNEIYALNEFSRPSKGNGFSYECTAAGTSGYREPAWPRTIGETVIDGSVTWTCRAAESNGVNPISLPTVSAPTALVVSEPSVSEFTNLLVTYSGGDLGADYDVQFTVTISGNPRVARQRVKIRAR